MLLLSCKLPGAYIWGANIIHEPPSNHPDRIFKKHIFLFLLLTETLGQFEYLRCLSSFNQLLLEAEGNPRNVIPCFSRAVTAPRAGAGGFHTGCGQA